MSINDKFNCFPTVEYVSLICSLLINSAKIDVRSFLGILAIDFGANWIEGKGLSLEENLVLDK